MEVKVIGSEVDAYIHRHKLLKKWKKVLGLFTDNPRHPSLRTEILEPKHRGIFSFRIDRKYRALFVVKNQVCLVFKVTNHYKK